MRINPDPEQEPDKPAASPEQVERLSILLVQLNELSANIATLLIELDAGHVNIKNNIFSVRLDVKKE